MALLSLLSLIIVILLSCITKVNPGLLSLGLAWMLGVFALKQSPAQIASSFPIYMFIVLVGVTYLFGLAKQNGTLEKLTQALLKLVKHNPFFSPLFFFILASVLSTLGAGNIGAVALLAPVAMAVAWETGMGAFFMTIALIAGANAGTFSPFALTGIIGNGLISKIGHPLNPWTQIYWPNYLAQAVLLALSYLFFFRSLKRSFKHQHLSISNKPSLDFTWSTHQRLTLGSIILLILMVVMLKVDIGFLALLLGSLLILLNAADGKETIKNIPWDTILMVCGVNTLIGMLEHLGGLNLLSDWLAKVSTSQNITAITALVTGIISAFSSSSGVVMPSFIPLAPDLIEKIGGGNLPAVISSINVGAHMVDISPLSSLGAICIASAIHEDREKLFKHLLGFGLSLAFIGALICFVLFGWLNIVR